MRYQLAELVAVSGFSVDTIRYYQSIGSLHPPIHEGRLAIYDDSHLDRLRLIRSMSAKGLPLKVISTLLAKGEHPQSDRALLLAIEKETTASCYTAAELAKMLGVPRTLIGLVERSGLLEALRQEDGSIRYSEAEVQTARGALKFVKRGIPLRKLMELALRHDRAVRKSVDDAIDLFNDYVRKRGGRQVDADPEQVAEAFRELLPVVTALVAHHFQRVLVARALRRLKRGKEHRALEIASRAASDLRLRLRW